MGVGAWLDSVSSLNLLSRQGFNSTDGRGSKTTNSVLSAATEAAALPLFLQDQGAFSSTRELLGNLQVGPRPEAKKYTKLSSFSLNFPLLLSLLDLSFSSQTTISRVSPEFL